MRAGAGHLSRVQVRGDRANRLAGGRALENFSNNARLLGNDLALRGVAVQDAARRLALLSERVHREVRALADRCAILVRHDAGQSRLHARVALIRVEVIEHADHADFAKAHTLEELEQIRALARHTGEIRNQDYRKQRPRSRGPQTHGPPVGRSASRTRCRRDADRRSTSRSACRWRTGRKWLRASFADPVSEVDADRHASRSGKHWNHYPRKHLFPVHGFAAAARARLLARPCAGVRRGGSGNRRRRLSDHPRGIAGGGCETARLLCP